MLADEIFLVRVVFVLHMILLRGNPFATRKRSVLYDNLFESGWCYPTGFPESGLTTAKRSGGAVAFARVISLSMTVDLENVTLGHLDSHRIFSS